jgi:hypothetical protein
LIAAHWSLSVKVRIRVKVGIRERGLNKYIEGKKQRKRLSVVQSRSNLLKKRVFTIDRD